ncbi:ATP-binding protein [Novosphingobium sp. BL-52-GroH]|uniref:HAMP domain-containing sensor histidine kinase n=1 Tax=Novosphingobium sp. BL-52-GroH TaxID=3349877 RepID=UPI00384E376F
MKAPAQSLRGLTIVFLGLFLAVTALAGIGMYFVTLSTINQLVDKRIAFESDELVPEGTAVGREDLARRIRHLTGQRDTGDLGLLLTDAKGRGIAGNTWFSRELPVGFSSLSRQDRIEGLSAGRVFVREIPGGMRLVVFAETEPIDDYSASRRLIYIAGFGAIVTVVLVGLLLFRRLVGQRIEAMRRTVDAIIDGDLSRRVPVVGDGGEFDQQAAAFNRMLDRIGLLMAEIRNVSNDISHELRTPLARLRNELSLLEQRDEAGSMRSELARATAQADDLLGMFGAMLRIAEIESGARRAGFRPLDLGTLIEDVVEMAQPLADDGNRRLAVMQCEAVPLVGDRQLLSQLLLNLVENALRHSPEGSQVRISAAKPRDGFAVVVVSDDGPGIAPDQRLLVLRRFGRLDRDRGRSGHGLGLPLADAIARLHRGSLVLEDAAPGLRVVVMLPA